MSSSSTSLSSPAAQASHSQESLSAAEKSPSASHSHSPSQSSLHENISLETLVAHLLASKRSLSSISTVWRANEIVTSARSALEDSATLTGRTGFLRNGILEQVKTLQKVRGGIEHVYNDGQREFKVCLLVPRSRCDADLRCSDHYSKSRCCKRTTRGDYGYASIDHSGVSFQTQHRGTTPSTRLRR